MQGVLPQASVAALMKPNFVGLASDVDDPEPPVLDLAMEHLADAMMLPFVLFTDAEGRFLAGSHGAVRPDTFLSTVRELVDGKD